MKEELSQIKEEKERFAYFENLVKEFDKADALNDRKHCRFERRANFAISMPDSTGDSKTPTPVVFKRLCNSDNWEDIIFSRSPEDLHEIVTNEALFKALRGLNFKRKEVLFYRVIQEYSGEEIGAFKGVSSRNIRKLYEKAIQEIKKRIAIDK